MAFASNLAAINAANAQLKSFFAAQAPNKDQLKMLRAEHFSIEKHDNEWHALIVKPFPMPTFINPGEAHASDAQHDEREGAFAFPKADGMPERDMDGSRFEEKKTEADMEAALEADRQANAIALQDAQASATGKAPKEWIHKSSVIKPTKLVWVIADEMHAQALTDSKPAPTRKEVQDECIRRGVASGTARTQYQAWKTAHDNANKNAAHAAALSAAFNKR